MHIFPELNYSQINSPFNVILINISFILLQKTQTKRLSWVTSTLLHIPWLHKNKV